jgi:hypothetical protein
MPLVSVSPVEPGQIDMSETLPNWRHRIMKLKTALFISLKIIALTVILFICWSAAGGVIGL